MKRQRNILLKILLKSGSLLFIFYFLFFIFICLTSSPTLYFRWAAYVAGAVLVLMTELGVRFEDSISMLVRVFHTTKFYIG